MRKIIFITLCFALATVGFAKTKKKISHKKKHVSAAPQTTPAPIETPKAENNIKPPTCKLIGPAEPLPPGGGEVVLQVIAEGHSQPVSAMKVTVTETTTISTTVEGPGGVGKCSVEVKVTPLPDISDIE